VLKRLLKPNSFSANVAVLVSGTALGQVIVVAASPLLTRIYSPDDFGILAVFSSILGMAVVVASLKYEIAILLPREEHKAFHVLALSVMVAAAMGVITLVAVVTLGSRISELANMPELHGILFLVPLGVFGSGVYQALSNWAVRQAKYTIIAKSRLTQSLGSVLAQLILGPTGLTAIGLPVGQVVGLTAGFSSLLKLSLASATIFLRDLGWRDLTAAAGRYRRFVYISSPAGLLNNAALFMPAIVIAALFSPQAAGWFALADRVVKMPINLLSRSLGQVYYQRAATLRNEGQGSLLRLYVRTAGNIAALAIIPALIFAIASPWLFHWLFGADWRMAGVTARFLSLSSFTQLLLGPLSQTLNVLERQDVQAVWDASRLILLVLAVFAIGQLDVPFGTSIAIYAACMAFGDFVLFIIMLYLVRHTT
jgi:O-antigen/teichoic acid export membrane protein